MSRLRPRCWPPAATRGIEAWLDFFDRQTAGDDETLEVFGLGDGRSDLTADHPARLTGPVRPRPAPATRAPRVTASAPAPPTGAVAPAAAYGRRWPPGWGATPVRSRPQQAA